MLTSRAPRARLLLPAAVTALLVVPGPAAHASWPGVDGRLAITQRIEHAPGKESWELFAYALDGTLTRLTNNVTSDQQSSWSPDGRRLAFKTNRISTRTGEQTYVLSWDTTGKIVQKRISQDSDDPAIYSTQPSWNPAGTRIIIRSNRGNASSADRQGNVWSMDADTGMNRTPLILWPSDERYPTLSPDGTRLLFTSDRDGTYDIWTTAADGSDPVKVYGGPLADSAPAWSPDGTKIAFEVKQDLDEIPDDSGDIWVVAADGSNPHQVIADAKLDEGAAWSPDGRFIAFMSERDGEGDVYYQNASGAGEPINLTNDDRKEESPDWQPLPMTVGAQELPRVACGDLSLAPGGVASVVSVKAPCDSALRVAQEWQAGADDGTQPPKVEGYECAVTPHIFDQELVECDHEGIKKGIAFVYRQSPAPTAKAMGIQSLADDATPADIAAGGEDAVDQPLQTDDDL
jgi:dipeptidyl aminopeptidase/acylaminoacyl peptidase